MLLLLLVMFIFLLLLFLLLLERAAASGFLIRLFICFTSQQLNRTEAQAAAVAAVAKEGKEEDAHQVQNFNVMAAVEGWVVRSHCGPAKY